jgi:hypothetical protein
MGTVNWREVARDRDGSRRRKRIRKKKKKKKINPGKNCPIAKQIF